MNTLQLSLSYFIYGDLFIRSDYFLIIFNKDDIDNNNDTWLILNTHLFL